jgi:anti-sigma factor RsiW
MNHLGPEEIVDAVDGALLGERSAHLAGCALCRHHMETLRAMLADVQASAVPEPSPLFWTHFTERVREAIDNDASPRMAWLPVWAGWRVLAPTGALALLIVALMTAVPHRTTPTSTDLATLDLDADFDAQPAALGEASWQFVSDLVDELDLDDSPQGSFVVIPGTIDQAAHDLGPSEREELLRLLRAELGRPES